MAIKEVIAPANLGAEFDIGVEEADKVHVGTGRGLWRDVNKLESIPWKPEQRWVVPGSVVLGAAWSALFNSDAQPASWDASNPSWNAIMNVVEAGGIATVLNFAGVAGLDITITEYPATVSLATYPRWQSGQGWYTANNNGNGTVNGWRIGFNQPVIINRVDIAITNALGSYVYAAGAAWSPNGAVGLAPTGYGTETLTYNSNGTSDNIGTVNPITELDVWQDGVTGSAVVLALTTLAGNVVTSISGSLYTIQEYTDGRLLAVNDNDSADILETTASMTLLDTAPLNNYTASAAPGSGDDSSGGYGRGSRWNDGTAEYACMDATVGAADWVLVT